jgi:acetolactate synthase small subunit
VVNLLSTQIENRTMSRRWVFVVRALNKPGTLTAAAAVFSNRGVSLEGILGSGISTTTAEDGRMLFSFWATEPKQDLLKRSLERLPSIFKVAAYDYEDPRLRAIAVAKVIPKASLHKAFGRDSEDLYVETISRSETSVLLLLSGGTIAVEDAIALLRQQQQLKDVVMSAITV